jgi:hypothetical protein
MTLRDLGSWASGVLERFGSDLQLVFSVSPLDWPIYMVVLSLPFAFAGLMLAMVVMVTPMAVWQAFWRMHFDSEGSPTTRLSRVADRIWDAFFLFCVFVLVWVVGAFLVAVVLLDEGGYPGAGVAIRILVFLMPTLVAGAVIFFTIRGRMLKKREGSK